MELDLDGLELGTRKAVSHFWRTRANQVVRQNGSGTSDRGARGAVTGGKQMDGFVDLLCELVKRAGMGDACIFRHSNIELPGYYRPTKQWDMLVVVEKQLLAVIELKSQVGPSFGNNFNNRTEEAIGSATDLWTAYREGAFKDSSRPWLGYVFVLEDCARSRAPVNVLEPHFAVFPEFRDASYLARYQILCRKLVLERLYDSAAFLASPADKGNRGEYVEPAVDLGMRQFAASLAARMAQHRAASGRPKP